MINYHAELFESVQGGVVAGHRVEPDKPVHADGGLAALRMLLNMRTS